MVISFQPPGEAIMARWFLSRPPWNLPSPRRLVRKQNVPDPECPRFYQLQDDLVPDPFGVCLADPRLAVAAQEVDHGAEF